MPVKILALASLFIAMNGRAESKIITPFEPVIQKGIAVGVASPAPNPSLGPNDTADGCMKKLQETCLDARGFKPCFDRKKSEFSAFCLGYFEARFERDTREGLFKDIQRACAAEIQRHCLYKHDLYAVSQCLQPRLELLGEECRPLVQSTLPPKER